MTELWLFKVYQLHVTALSCLQLEHKFCLCGGFGSPDDITTTGHRATPL